MPPPIMKHHLPLFLACLVFAGNLFAQQHLSFKGVPINGTREYYTDTLIKSGFYYQGTTHSGISLLGGDFAGYEDCLIGVYTLKNLNLVNRVAVFFPDRDTWSAVLGDYEHLKTMLTEKYGTPADSQEKFTGYIGDNKNSLIMSALKNNKYVWYTTFTTELGDIKLSIMAGSKHDTAMVRLTYTDKANSEKVRSAAIDDL